MFVLNLFKKKANRLNKVIIKIQDKSKISPNFINFSVIYKCRHLAEMLHKVT